MSLISLSREYPSKAGAPAISRVDSDIFELRYFAWCMDCDFCHDTCCSYGADIDADDAERVKSLGRDFEAFVGRPAGEWFDGNLIDDGEFPGGRMMRVRAENGHCVMLNTDGRGCKIHSYCLRKGLDYHVFKPVVCWLFGVTFEYGNLVPSNEIKDKSLICYGKGPTLFEAAKEELRYFFGADFVAELEKVRDGLAA
jgi:hypothetical protein